jgi:hypothetical protein
VREKARQGTLSKGQKTWAGEEGVGEVVGQEDGGTAGTKVQKTEWRARRKQRTDSQEETRES